MLMPANERINNEIESSKIYFKKLNSSELKEILNKNDNIFSIKELQSIRLPIVGIANCTK